MIYSVIVNIHPHSERLDFALKGHNQKNTGCFSCLLQENFAIGNGFTEDNKKDGSCRHAIFNEFIIIHKKQKKARGSLENREKYAVIQVVILQLSPFTNV